jgi:predicted amidohydrolase
MAVAVAQIPVSWSASENTERVLAVIGRAEPGSLLVFPEAALSGYDDDLSGLDELSPADLAAARHQVAAAAARTGVHVVCGSLLREDDRWYNAGLYFPPAGDPVIYRKVNLATHERGRLAAGSALPVLEMRRPDGVLRAGLQLCREIRYPEQWACLARQGADVLIYLTYAVNPAQPPGVWRAHLISRAAETQRFVLAANVAGQPQHCPTMIISPRGEVLAEAPGGEPVVLRQVIDLADVSDVLASQQRADVVRLTYLAR